MPVAGANPMLIEALMSRILAPPQPQAMNPAPQTPVPTSNFAADNANLDRREKLIAALMGGGSQVPLGYYTGLNALSDVLQRGAGAYKLGGIADERSKVMTAAAGQRASGLDSVANALVGRDAGALAPHVKSQFPEVSEAALKGITELGKPAGNVQVEEFGIPGQPDMAQKFQREGNGWKPVGEPYRKRADAQAGNVPLSQKERFETFRTANRWHQDKDNRELALGGGQRLRELDKGISLVLEGASKGNLAGARGAVAQLVHSLGGQLDAKTATNEQIRAVLGPLILERARKLAPVTELDLQTIERMVGADPTRMTDEALIYTLNEFKRGTETFANEYNRVGKHLKNIVSGKGSDEDYGELFSVGSGVAAAPAAPAATAAPKVAAPPAGAPSAPKNARGWPLMQDAAGNKAYVGPNGEIEEVK